MFFAFRWLLIWFKREFSIPDVLKIWETCLCDIKSPEYQLFIAMALLDLHRKEIMEKLTDFDHILKFINELSENVQVDDVLKRAEELYWIFENKLRSIHAHVAAQSELVPRISPTDIELAKSLKGLALVRDLPLIPEN
jgi:hypothetical protein